MGLDDYAFFVCDVSARVSGRSVTQKFWVKTELHFSLFVKWQKKQTKRSWVAQVIPTSRGTMLK